jgi:hypothetical protein
MTTTLGALLGVCALLAGAKFIRSRAKLLLLLVRAQGALFAVLMGGLAATTMIVATDKDPPTNQVQQIHQYENMQIYQSGNAGMQEGLQQGNGSSAFPNYTFAYLHNCIFPQDVSNGWRAVETRAGCEIVGCDAFDSPQIHAPWLMRGGYKDRTRIAPYGWTFPWRDGILEEITVFSEGELRVSVHTNYFPIPFDAPLAVVPSFNWNLLPGGVSNVFWYAVSSSNSLVITWENSPVNHDVNNLTNFQAEFFADGRFAYRYQDCTVEYAPIFPFDWDGDGLENSVDPEPLVTGPDAHGTNVEWYNNVCSNVYEAAEADEPASAPAGTEIGPRDLAPPGISLSSRTSVVNTNAYYFVEVVASRGPAPIYFTADGESRLGNPVVVARAGETNHVPLLIGASYCISSSVPVTVVAPDAVVFSSPSSGGGPALLGAVPYQQGNLSTLIYPAVLGYVDIAGICSPVLDYWMMLGGELVWSGGCCMWLHGDSMAFECRSCDCGGCAARLTYMYEGYAISAEGPSCGCISNGSGGVAPPTPDPDEPDVSIAFDRRHVLISTSCLGYGSRSTETELTISANGGVQGGVLEWGVENVEKLSAGDGNLALSGFCVVSSNGTFSGARTVAGAAVSDRLRDVRAWAVLYESGTGVRHVRESRTTVCRVSVDQIRFNYNFQGYHNDAINIRPNAKADYDYTNGEWADGGMTNNPACYVGTCRPKVHVRFKVEPSGITDACIRAVASSQDFTLGDLPVTNVVFAGTNSQWTVFEALDGEEIGWYVNKTAARWDWILSEIESESVQPFWTDSTGPHTIYTVLAHPTAPWEAARSAAQRPWASALDFACQTATGARTANAALTAITQKLFSNMGFSYETCSGAPNYRVPQKGKFRLSRYLKGNGNVNCYDQAYAVVALGNILGASTHVEVASPFGFIESLELVGVGLCNNPAFSGSEKTLVRAYVDGVVRDVLVTVPRTPLVGIDSIERSFFNSHAFAVLEGNVYDACVGPALGIHSVSNYIESVIDHSTEDERLNGFYSAEQAGAITQRASVFVLE